MDEGKKKTLDAALKSIDKAFGKGTLVRLGDKQVEPIDAISTGSVGLDIALGIGGVPKGRIIEVYGPESSGKTTLTLHIIAECQKAGGICAFVDAEHALDVKYASNLGVDTDNLYVSQPDFGEQALDIVETLAKSGAIDLIVVDSVAALTPKNEIDGDMGDQVVGMHARLMSRAMRKLTGFISKSRTVAVFINQIREKVGVMFGSPETTTGGRALKFYSTVRLDVRKTDKIMQGQEMIGNRTKVRVVKNKVAPPFRTAEFDIMYGEGVSRVGTVLDIATDFDIINKSGSWYSYDGSRLGQGKENVKKALKEKPELAAEIEEKVRAKLMEQATAAKEGEVERVPDEENERGAAGKQREAAADED